MKLSDFKGCFVVDGCELDL